jgi:hypothetical protein
MIDVFLWNIYFESMLSNGMHEGEIESTMNSSSKIRKQDGLNVFGRRNYEIIYTFSSID